MASYPERQEYRQIALRPPRELSAIEKKTIVVGNFNRMLDLIAAESLDGLEKVLGTLIESSDRLASVMRNKKGEFPEPISDEIRQLLSDPSTSEIMARFIATPAALEWLDVLNQLRLVQSGQVAVVAGHLVDRGLLPGKNESWYKKKMRQARGVAKRVYMQLPEGAIALAEIPQVMAAFEVCRWWAKRVIEAQEVADLAQTEMDKHLDEGDEIARLAAASVEAFEKYKSEMEVAQRELEVALGAGRGINVMTDGKERVADAKRARDLLDQQAKMERQQAVAAAQFTRSILELDEMIKSMDQRHSEAKVYLRALLAANRRLAVTERGLKVTLAAIRLTLSAAVAQATIAEAACLAQAIDGYELLLTGAVAEAIGSAQTHYQLLVSPQGKKTIGEGDVVDGEFKVSETE